MSTHFYYPDVQYAFDSHDILPTAFIAVNQLGPPNRCHRIRTITKRQKAVNAIICNIISHFSTFLFFRITIPIMSPVIAPKA